MFCTDISEPFLLIFSSDVPGYIYYFHFPATIISLLFGFYILKGNHKLLSARIFFAISIVFSIWTILSLITWANIDPTIIMFSWSLNIIIYAVMLYLIFYFYYILVFKKNIPKFINIISLFILLPVSLITPTTLNLLGFDLINCESIENPLFFNAIYYFSFILAFIIVLTSIYLYVKNYSFIERKQLLPITFGIVSFILMFFGTGYPGSLTDNYLIDPIGLLGMTVLTAFLAFLIVRFKAFNIKLIGAQALMWSIALLVGSQLFFVKTLTNTILTSITFLITIVAGVILVRSVKKVDEQKERLEVISKQLEKANQHLRELDQLKSEFVSMATHQIRSPISAIRGYTSMLLEGDFGQLAPQAKEPVETINKSAYSLGLVVEDFLNISRMEQGRMKYDMTNFDMKNLVEEVMRESQPNMKASVPVTFSCIDCDHTDHTVMADKGKIKQVLGNLLDNSIKYTPTGWIKVSLEKALNDNKEKVIKVSISDSGVGISAETMPLLFSKFSRAKDANRTNIRGTGLGLYVAKQIVMAHTGGDIWAESPGEGKGSTFILELPVK